MNIVPDDIVRVHEIQTDPEAGGKSFDVTVQHVTGEGILGTFVEDNYKQGGIFLFNEWEIEILTTRAHR